MALNLYSPGQLECSPFVDLEHLRTAFVLSCLFFLPGVQWQSKPQSFQRKGENRKFQKFVSENKSIEINLSGALQRAGFLGAKVVKGSEFKMCVRY